MNRRADRINFDLFAETGRLTAVQDLGPAAVFNVSLSTRLWGRFGIGTTVSFAQTTSTATLGAQVPHPFFFEFPRSVTGSAGGLAHRELAIHVQGQYRMPLGDRLSLLLFLGPTRFEARQELVAELTTAERGFPFDEVDIVSHASQTVSVTGTGYNIGFDLTYFGLRQLGFLGSFEILDRVGAAVMLRYSRAAPSIRFAGEFQPALELGGTHALGGLRLAF